MTMQPLPISSSYYDHFHGPETNCRVEPHVIKRLKKSSNGKIKIIQMRASKCETHKLITCHCGWEWGWHNATYSQGLPTGEEYWNNEKFWDKVLKKVKPIQQVSLTT